MAKKLFLLACLVLAMLQTHGQATITRADGAVLKVSVLEMKPGLLLFKLSGQPDTLIYQISTQDVAAVRLADGSTRTFSPPESDQKQALPFDYETHSGRNILWYYPLDLFNANFTLAYERISASGKIGVKVPLLIGLRNADARNNYTDYQENNRFGTGMELNIYPFGQGRLQYFFGPAIQYRAYRNYYYSSFSSAQPEPVKQNASLFSLALKNGLYYQFTKSFIVSLDVGIGYRIFRERDLPDDYYNPYEDNQAYFPGNLHLGYRF